MNRFINLIIATTSFAFAVIAGSLSVSAASIPAPALSLHSAPASNSTITSTVAQGTMVDVGVCNSSWCYVTEHGHKGWVETSKLSTQIARANSEVMSAGSGGAASGYSGHHNASTGLHISVTIVPEEQEAHLHSGKHLDISKISSTHLH